MPLYPPPTAAKRHAPLHTSFHIYVFSHIIAMHQGARPHEIRFSQPKPLAPLKCSKHIMNPVLFYKCLADDTRLRCLLLITREEELCVCELMEALQEIQPKISRHLAQMRRCKLLVDRRQGQWVFYRINPALPEWAKTVLKSTLESNTPFLASNVKLLCKMGDRPARAQACC